MEQTLAGHADRLKGYTIATAVFERDASFDAQADPVVRTEAGRLRRALERYYLVAGQADPVLIEVPKGGYVPIFSRRAALRAEVAGWLKNRSRSPARIRRTRPVASDDGDPGGTGGSGGGSRLAADALGRATREPSSSRRSRTAPLCW